MNVRRTPAVLLRSQSDERLVALSRAGHEPAFETIVRRYRRPLMAASRRMVEDGRAEDVLHRPCSPRGERSAAAMKCATCARGCSGSSATRR